MTEYKNVIVQIVIVAFRQNVRDKIAFYLEIDQRLLDKKEMKGKIAQRIDALSNFVANVECVCVCVSVCIHPNSSTVDWGD